MPKDDEFLIQVLTYGAIDLSMGGRGLTYDDLKSKCKHVDIA